MADSTQVLFASEEVTVHVADAGPRKDQFGHDYWDVRSQTLLPGQSVPVSELPDYVVDAVKAGKVSGASIVSSDKAKQIAERADELRSLVTGPAAYQYADGWDNSHSDHLVEDAVRAADLSLRAESDAGGGDDRPSGTGPEGETDTSGAAEVAPASSAPAEDTGDNSAEKQAAAGSGGEESEKQSSAKGDSSSAKK